MVGLQNFGLEWPQGMILNIRLLSEIEVLSPALFSMLEPGNHGDLKTTSPPHPKESGEAAG
jgi:hypothetical protein